MALLDEDRLFPATPRVRDIARALYQTVADLPIISPFARGPGSKARFEAAIRACAPR